MHIQYFGPFAKRTGFAQAAHDYMLALHRAGVSLEIRPLVECNSDDLDERYHELMPLVAQGDSKKEVSHRIVHTVPRAVPMFLPSAPQSYKRIAITTWETTHPSQDITDGLSASCDKIIVPSLFCGNALGAARADMAIVPHCFDPSHWPVAKAPRYESPYTFYSVLGWSERKNPIGLIKAYLAEFTSDDDVMLTLKVSGYSNDDLAALVRATNIPSDRLPGLDIVSCYYDHEDMVEFHHDGHCFVTAARGEGWNLPAFEAALCGKPVITPNFGGQMDYLKGYCNTQKIGHFLTPAIAPPVAEEPIDIAGLKVRPVTQTAPSGITAQQHWAEPDLYSLQRAMRDHCERRVPVDLSSRKAFEDDYGYATVGAKLARLLERMN
jgi:glycosyltransferase involved in cell wall biosynthesis